MRVGINMAAAIAATVLGTAGSDRARTTIEREMDRPPGSDFNPRSSYALKGGGGKKLAMGAYKGSQAAKRATRRGGNPARSGLPR